MDHDYTNRLAATTRKRGRPSNAEIAARQTVPAEAVQIMVPMAGLRMPCCGRTVVPRILRTLGRERTVACTCGHTARVAYDEKDAPLTITVLK